MLQELRIATRLGLAFAIVLALTAGVGTLGYVGASHVAVLVAVVLAVAAGAIVAFVASRSVTEPLEAVATAIAGLARGDFSAMIPAGGRDEVGAMLVHEVAAASAEQASSVTQINRAMSRVDEVTQRNAAASEELASTAEEVSAQAQALTELIAFFRLDAAGAPPRGAGANAREGRRRAA